MQAAAEPRLDWNTRSIHDLGTGVYEADHLFAVEWQRDRIEWFFFLILNLAVGGAFGGPVAPDTVFPQSMLVDYVRVYQRPAP